MAKKQMKRSWSICSLLMLVAAMFFVGCDEGDFNPDNGIHGTPFVPGQSTVVTDFIPKTGGAGTRLVVYGKNFGNDTTRVHVTIGGVPAKVINTLGESLLCQVPNKAYSGEIVVTVLDEEGNELQSGVCEDKFDYQRKTLVSTFCGTMYENNTKYDVKAGPFDDCGGFDRLLWMKFDPLDPDMLYVAAEKKSFRIFDFHRQYADVFTTNIDNVSSCDFTKEGDLVLSRDQTNDQNIGLYMFTRESGFKTRLELCKARAVKCVATHPVNGRIYYTLYRKGELWSVDPYNPLDNHMEVGLPRTGTGVLIVWHPTGDYCYLMHYERHTIWRSDYDKTTGTMSTPYLICGKDNTANWADGVGSSVRMKKPLQGVFVKNPEYAGQEDEYDFYFCDNGTHSIRVLTPMGRVYTYAGRSDGGSNGYRNGDLRNEALFYYPESIVWDAKRECFLIGDTNNRRVRKIGKEE